MRDLVAHLVAWDELLLYRTRREHAEVFAKFAALYAKFAALYATSFASMRLLNYRLQRRTRDLDPPALTRRFAGDDGVHLKWLFDGTNRAAHLAEYVIHHEDIRRPLGLCRTVPSDRLAAGLEGILRLPGVRASAWWRLRRARVQASDIDWVRGRGPAKRMTGEATLMWLPGRTA